MIIKTSYLSFNLEVGLAIGRNFIKILLLFFITLDQQSNAEVKPEVNRNRGDQHLIGFYSFGKEAADKSLHARMITLINADGTNERYPDFKIADQSSWYFGPLFSDGRRIILSSFGEAKLSQIRGIGGEIPFRTWIYDLHSGDLQEILNHGNLPPNTRPILLLPGEKRIVVAATPKNSYHVLAVDLNGQNPQELVGLANGFAYCLCLSPNKRNVAFHITQGEWGNLKKPSPFSLGHYNINVLNLNTHERILVAGAQEHLYFGPQWSPDGKWLAYVDCQPEKSPTHFRGDVCIGKTDGTKNIVLTEAQPHWFGAAWGTSEYAAGSSNMVSWSPNGKTILFTRLLPGSEPDRSRGGTQLCLIDFSSRKIDELTAPEESLWVHHASWSWDGKQIIYYRGKTGEPAELWIMNSDGSGQRMLSKGYKMRGVQLSPEFLGK